jgi:hypothetical protein
MKSRIWLGAALALFGAGATHPAAAVEFGAPDFPNYLSRPGVVTCDWNYPSYWRACPTPDIPPKPPKAEPASAPAAKGKPKKS